MSQKRQTTEEVMAAREAMEEKLPENVTPLPFADLDLPDFEPFDDADLPSAEEVQKSLEEAMEANAQAPEETEAPDADPDILPQETVETADVIKVECPCCGAQILAESPEDAIQICKCNGAKVLRQESEMNQKIDFHFGPASKEKFGAEHTPEELNIMKLVAAYVAKHKIKNVTITLNGSDKAVFLIKKDATIVRHTRAIKAESEV